MNTFHGSLIVTCIVTLSMSIGNKDQLYITCRILYVAKFLLVNYFRNLKKINSIRINGCDLKNIRLCNYTVNVHAICENANP